MASSRSRGNGHGARNFQFVARVLDLLSMRVQQMVDLDLDLVLTKKQMEQQTLDKLQI